MRLLKLLLRLSLALLVLMALAVGAMAWWLSGDGPRMKAQDAASEALGVPVRIERVSLELKPLPALAVHGLRIQTKAALSVQKLSVRPAWAGLLHEPRQLELLALHLENASLPQAGIDQLQQSLNQKQSRAPKQPAAPQLVGLLTIPQRIVLEQVTWQSTTDDRLVVSGSIQLNNARELAQLDLKLAGGTVRGSIRMLGLQTRGPIQIKGEINSSQLELSQLPGLRSRMSGRLDAKTELSGQASQLQQLPATVQSSTAFNVQAAAIKGVDLAKAVKTLGMSRDGQTPLSRLSGQLSTRGLGPSMLITLSALQASSSLLNASGGVQVGAASGPAGARPLSGKINVDLNAPDAGSGAGKALGALVGIPLEISGTTAAPQVQPSRGAMIGGTIGSVMAPVIGTGAGAKMGDRVGEKLSGLKEKLFGK